MFDKPVWIAIVGGIAVGKSTIIKSLYDEVDNCKIIEEDVAHNIFLSDFYADMKKWAFHSRISTLAMIANNYLQVPNNPPPKFVLLDRCIDELITFAQLHYDRGNMSDKEFEVYKILYHTLIKLSPAIDLFIFANCAPEISIKRIKERNRAFEQGITIDYINTINKYYSDWISTLDSSRVVSLNTDRPVPKQLMKDILKSIALK